MSGMSYSSSSSSMPPASVASGREEEVSSDEEEEAHESEEEEEEEVVQKDQQGAASSSTGKKRSRRGPSKMPSEILPLNKRPTIEPVGDRNWYVVSTGKHTRQVNGIISLLLKKHFPGLVILNGKEEPGFTWAHYQAASDDKLSSKAERIKAEVWDYFTCAEGFQVKVGVAIENNAKKILPDMLYEAQIRAVIRFHGPDETGKMMKKKFACTTHLERAEYLSVIPKCCEKHPACWEKMVDTWCDDAWQATHSDKREDRLMMEGVSHRQGSLNVTGFWQNLEKNCGGQQINVYEAYLHGHRGKEPGEEYCSPQAMKNINNYESEFRKIHGEESNPRQHPLDPVAVMMAGKGKKHGRFCIADGAISTSSTLSLPKIRAQSMSSSSSTCSGLSPTRSKISQLEAKLEEEQRLRASELGEERRLREEAERRHAATTQALQEQIQMLFARIGEIAPTPPPQT